jgi:hypothetical protein
MLELLHFNLREEQKVKIVTVVCCSVTNACNVFALTCLCECTEDMSVSYVARLFISTVATWSVCYNTAYHRLHPEQNPDSVICPKNEYY